ncbi:MAG: endonuclease/exonuclease/phosphatase family protein [Bacteroidales bacterium]|nr:endonuclease/exonuclease/phosphatase family protein [Bacteroidales bacterium]
MRKVVKKILFLLNILVAAALLVAYAAVHISPVHVVLPAFFGLAYPYILLVNIIFMVFWATNLKKEALLSLTVILLGITHLNNFISFGGSSAGGGDMSLFSYNVRLFNRYEKSGSSEKEIAAIIRRESPDIICLQEFYASGNGLSSVRDFASLLSGKYEAHYKSMPDRTSTFYGIVTLSSFPVINRGDIVHPLSSSLTIFTDVVIGTDTIRVYNNHLQSFRLKKIERTFLEDISSGPDNELIKEFRILSGSLRQGFIERARQAEALSEHIKESPYPVVICGDFNDTPVSYSYRKIRKGLHDAFLVTGSGTGFTYRDKYPPNRIDYILYESPMKCTGFEIIREKMSDHYPVKAHFTINSDSIGIPDK